ncbi:MAG: guanylate kinase [Bacteroidales bacterium]|jgi:guanylate kinase|nr:guanylate kinase [Bacteroidales bacterium]
MGKLIIFSAPSGAGKTTLVKHVLEHRLPLAFSISACTRSMRPGEVNGRDYYFMTVPEFQKHIENDDFVEWEEVYEGSYYGTLNSEVNRIWSEGKHVLFDVDVKGGLALKKKFGEKALAIFVEPPSVEELERRLVARSTDSEEKIRQRVAKAEYELTFAPQFDCIIINDDLKKAQEEAVAAIQKFIEVSPSSRASKGC